MFVAAYRCDMLQTTSRTYERLGHCPQVEVQSCQGSFLIQHIVLALLLLARDPLTMVHIYSLAVGCCSAAHRCLAEPERPLIQPPAAGGQPHRQKRGERRHHCRHGEGRAEAVAADAGLGAAPVSARRQRVQTACAASNSEIHLRAGFFANCAGCRCHQQQPTMLSCRPATVLE